jgi:hypothetical protein
MGPIEYLRMGFRIGGSMRRGQITAAAIMWVVYTIALFAMTYPILNFFVQNVTQDPNCDPYTRTILPFCIPLTAMGIAMGIVVYSTPQRPQNY